MKTEGLKQALNKYRFDAAFGGAATKKSHVRRSGSSRSATSSIAGTRRTSGPALESLQHKGQQEQIDPRLPDLELDQLDVWQYIHLENIPMDPLYFAKERPIVYRDGTR